MINNNKNEGENEKYHKDTHSVHPPPFLLGGCLSLRPNFQRGRGLAGSQFLEGGCWERGVTFFRRVVHKK